jgi:hypothetical protein
VQRGVRVEEALKRLFSLGEIRVSQEEYVVVPANVCDGAVQNGDFVDVVEGLALVGVREASGHHAQVPGAVVFGEESRRKGSSSQCPAVVRRISDTPTASLRVRVVCRVGCTHDVGIQGVRDWNATRVRATVHRREGLVQAPLLGIVRKSYHVAIFFV